MSSRQQTHRLRIGIYAGTFDPVHVGHITFALQAIKNAKLDRVVFLPERFPRRKRGAEHYGHRVAMLKRATAPYPNMAVMELADKYFTVARTWPQLQAAFPEDTLAVLIGTDVLTHITTWPKVEAMLPNAELIVGTRAGGDQPGEIALIVRTWPVRPKQLHIVESHAPQVSSTSVRQALAKRSHTHGLLTSVRAYARANWLYVSIEQALHNK